MLKKEMTDVLKQTFYFLAAVLLLPGILIVTALVRDVSYFQIFFPLFQFGLLFWALFMGISLFSTERGQRGMEYLLSLPYSRLRLIGLKILPRATVVLALYLVCWLLYTQGGEKSAAVHSFSFTLLYFALFCIALSLSASSENFLVLFVFSLFTLFVFFGLMLGIFWAALQARGYIYYELELRPFFTDSLDKYLVNLLIPIALGLLLPLLLSLFLSFKKFDLRPVKNYNKRFFRVFAPVLILCLIGCFVFAHQTLDIGRTNYYLTQNLQVVESNAYSGVKIYDEQKPYKVSIDVDYLRPLWEESVFLYFRDRNNRVGRLDTREHTTDILYEAPPGKWIDWSYWGYERTMAFLERKRDYSETHLVLMDIDSGQTKKIPLNKESFTGESIKEYYNWYIFGADEVDGMRFWLMCPGVVSEERSIYQLWEDGRIDSIGTSRKWPCYLNRTLFSYTKNEIIVSEHKKGLFEALRSIPNEEDFHFGWYVYSWRKLTNFPVHEIYGQTIDIHSDEKNTKRTYSTKYARLNLENFEIDKLDDVRGDLSFYSPESNVFYALEEDDSAREANLFEVIEGTLKHMKTFKDVDPATGLKVLDFTNNGLLIKEGRRIKIYSLPDLKRVH
jgi:ABC-type transport system involved in multi-copper enzyme maturation permease subunit